MCQCDLSQTPEAIAYEEAWRDARDAMYAYLDASRENLDRELVRGLAVKYQGLRFRENQAQEAWSKKLDEHRFCTKRKKAS